MSLSGAEPAARGVWGVSDKLPRETERFAQAFSNKGAALALPETLSLDSAGAAEQPVPSVASRHLPTLWGVTPAPVGGHSPPPPNFVAARKLAQSVQTA